ncbi:MAG: hypothetical protein SPF88_03000, partial [Schaalia hyovaginalis]|uniref:hypothetical protein n=1 Tax=Schaalia hyovaginalis TaxID=29316 RepID=UPI002A90B878
GAPVVARGSACPRRRVAGAGPWAGPPFPHDEDARPWKRTLRRRAGRTALGTEYPSSIIQETTWQTSSIA